MNYNGLRGRISELNKWGYVIRRTNENGLPQLDGEYFKCLTIPVVESTDNLLYLEATPDSDGRVEIIPLGDIHYGNPCFSEESESKLDGYIDYILKTDGAYTILMGDLIESANERGTFKIKLSPQEQFEWILYKFRPLADAKKIIAIITGNHELWIFNDKGFDIIKTLSLNLKVPYLGDSGYIGLKVGNQLYTIYATHPNTGVTKKSTKLKMLEDLGSIHNVDIVLCGHIHSIITEDQITRVPDFLHREVINKKQLLIGTGSFLEYGDYAEQARYKPEKMGAPKIKLYNFKWDMHVGK
jgi:UDP-2,3-diacylglucosamine pyrophosphatase LpxH